VADLDRGARLDARRLTALRRILEKVLVN